MSALILVAEADPFELRLLSELCSTLGYDVVPVGDGVAVLDTVARARPDLVLMNASLPGLDGLQVLRILKADDGLSHLPVVLATNDGDDETRKRGLEMGAEDYITKPYKSFEIQQRLRTVLRLSQGGVQTAAQVRAERLDVIDPVTGAGTISQLHISLEYEFTRAVRYRHPLACVVVRCENYASIATAIGGSTSQRVLVQMCGALRSCIRGVDHLFRSGAEELTILLPETDARGCAIVVGRLEAHLYDDGLFGADIRPRPIIAVAHACYPIRDVNDGEALWRSVTTALAAGAKAAQAC